MRGPPTENFDESMNYTENHRLVRKFGRGALVEIFLAYFWFVAFLEFGHVGHKGLSMIWSTVSSWRFADSLGSSHVRHVFLVWLNL